MILELGTPALEAIQITADYSNAVLIALMPYFSDFAHKLDLPVPQPVTAAHVMRCGILPWRDRDGNIAGCGVMLKGGWGLSFESGLVKRFQGPHSYFGLQDPDEIPKFYGKVRMSRDEAVQMARSTLNKLGIPLESVFAEQEPSVTLPERIGTNIVPHYRIEWLRPQSGSHAVDVEINADAKRVERLAIVTGNLDRAPPNITVVPPLAKSPARSRVNPAYAWKLLPIVLRAVDDYSKALSLAIARPLTTNHVARFSLDDNRGWPHSELELTNGWRFIYRNSMVNGFYAPDNFFSKYQRHVLIKDFIGKWNMTEAEAIQLVHRTLAKLNYPTNHVHIDFRPRVSMAAVNKQNIPRFDFSWWYKEKEDEDIHSKVEAEVDADKRELKSFYYDDKTYWNHPPQIDVPISLPPARATNQPAETSGRPPANKAPSRPPAAFYAPVPR